MKQKYPYVYGIRRKDGKQTFLGPLNKFRLDETLEKLDSNAKIVWIETRSHARAKSEFKAGRFINDGDNIDVATTPLSSSL